MKTFFVQPLITEKSMAMAASGVYQFVVPKWANKKQVAVHVKNQFGVEVTNVRTANFVPAMTMFKRKPGQQASTKKATVTLVKGATIADFSLPVEETAQPETPTEKPKKEAAPAKTESTITVRSKSRKSEV